MDHHHSPVILEPCLFPSFLSPLLSLCPSLQFIFQFAPRSSQVCARRKFAEAAGAPLEATWRRDRRGTISPSPPSLSLPRVLSHVLFSFSPVLSFPHSCLSVSSVSSLPGYTGPQGDLLLAAVPQHRTLSSPPSPTASPNSSSFGSCPPPLYFSPFFCRTLPRGKTVRPSSPELSISDGVYLQRDRPTHLERIFTSVHTLFPAHSLLGSRYIYIYIYFYAATRRIPSAHFRTLCRYGEPTSNSHALT